MTRSRRQFTADEKATVVRLWCNDTWWTQCQYPISVTNWDKQECQLNRLASLHDKGIRGDD